MLPMLTIVVKVSQNNTIYKCTKLHNHRLNRKWDIFQTRIPYFGRSGGGAPP